MFGGNPLRESVKITKSSHIFLLDSKNGNLLANSVPGTTFSINYTDPTLAVTPFKPETTNDTHTRDLGLFLRDKHGNYSLIPNMNETVSIETTIGGTKWIVNYRYLNNSNTWLLVVAIPRSDFFSKTDSAQQKALILACVLAVVGLIITVISTWVAVKPLHTLTIAIEMVTKLNFSALEGDILNDRSFMLELRRMQVAFAL
ncbi:hypothetical protein HDU76_000298 [Blyttiomyces sp. JEL0837]|nr:hypothetical protein HDU76_000298 [Blyttiomyces sp. JEL0837]